MITDWKFEFLPTPLVSYRAGGGTRLLEVVRSLASGSIAEDTQELVSLGSGRRYPGSVNTEGFSLLDFLGLEGIDAQKGDPVVFQFPLVESPEDAASMALGEFSENFYHLWYLGTDDLLLADVGGRWLVYVHHSDCLYLFQVLVQKPTPEGSQRVAGRSTTPGNADLSNRPEMGRRAFWNERIDWTSGFV